MYKHRAAAVVAFSAAFMAVAGSVAAQTITAPGVEVRANNNGALVSVPGAQVKAAGGGSVISAKVAPPKSETSAGSGIAGASKPDGASANTRREYINVDLSNQNFAKADFSGYRFVNVDLSNSNLSQANLQGAVLENVHLESANLIGANLKGARLVNVRLGGASTQGAIWTDGQRRY